MQCFTVDLIVNSLHPTFHEHNQGETKLVNRCYCGSGISIATLAFSLIKSKSSGRSHCLLFYFTTQITLNWTLRIRSHGFTWVWSMTTPVNTVMHSWLTPVAGNLVNPIILVLQWKTVQFCLRLVGMIQHATSLNVSCVKLKTEYALRWISIKPHVFKTWVYKLIQKAITMIMSCRNMIVHFLIQDSCMLWDDWRHYDQLSIHIALSTLLIKNNISHLISISSCTWNTCITAYIPFNIRLMSLHRCFASLVGRQKMHV